MDNSHLEISKTQHYYEIACQANSQAQEYAKKRIGRLPAGTNEIEELLSYSKVVYNQSTIAVVFSAMTLESFINEYSIKSLPKNIFKNHLDKLSLLSKFIITPKLNGGSEMNTDCQEYQDLNWLIKLRNDLVHFKFKSYDVQMLTKDIINKNYIWEEHSERAVNCINCYNYID